jgi:hypothetical protein
MEGVNIVTRYATRLVRVFTVISGPPFYDANVLLMFIRWGFPKVVLIFLLELEEDISFIILVQLCSEFCKLAQFSSILPHRYHSIPS